MADREYEIPKSGIRKWGYDIVKRHSAFNVYIQVGFLFSFLLLEQKKRTAQFSLLNKKKEEVQDKVS